MTHATPARALVLGAICFSVWCNTARASIVIVSQSGFGFTPQNVTIQIGDTVRWQQSSFAHTVTEGTDGTIDGDELFNGTLDSVTPTFDFTFDAVFVSAHPRPNQRYDYFCEPHFPVMIGSVTIASEPGTSMCFGDGSVINCPCGVTQNGTAGHGCGNSVNTGGALLAAAGTTAPDTVQFAVHDVPPGVGTIYLQGATQIAPVQFGDGLRCAGGALIRLGLRNDTDNDGVTTLGPGTGDPQISATGGVISGNTYVYQTYYRNPNPTWCPPNTFNASQGYRITW